MGSTPINPATLIVHQAPDDGFPEVDSAFGHWFAGFTDGEGSFKIVKRNRGVTYQCDFAIAVRADDLDVLREIQRRLGMGRIYVRDRYENAAGRHNPSATFVVNRKQELARLVEIFDAFPLRAKKARDYGLWRRGVVAWLAYEGNRWHDNGERPWAEMARVKAEIEEGRRWRAEAATAVAA